MGASYGRESSFIELNNEKEIYNLGKSIEILKDEKGLLTINDVSGDRFFSQYFKSEKKVPNFGITPTVFWVKIKIKNLSTINQWFLSLDYHYLDNVQFFKHKNNTWKVYQTGDRKKFSQREISHRGFVFKIFPKEKTTYFLRLKSRGSIQIPLKIYSPEAFYKYESLVYCGFGLFFGSILVMIFYNLFVFFSTKNMAYIHYVFFLGSFLVLLMAMSGFGYQFIFPNSPFLQNKGIPLMGLLTMVAISLFTQSYMDLKDATPRVFMLLNWFIILASLFLLLSPWIPYKAILIFALVIILIVLLPLVLTGVYFRVKSRYRPSYFFIFAFGSLILGASFKVLNNMGMLPSVFIFTQGLYIGGIIQAIVLALGLADIINSLKQDALQKAEKLAIAKEQLIEANKNLEDKVRERTADLSDALGDISNLLDNMRQAVFTSDKDGKILSPVSIFSNEIFQENIEGKKINDTIFKDIDKKGELFSSLQFSLSIIFGADDLQWEMVKDHFPKRIIFKNKDNLDTILKIAYTPLWDNDGLLERIMFVVEDITEIEILEKEMEEQKMESLKNIQILQELASNKKDDLNLFFSNTSQMCLDALYLAKKMRSQVERVQGVSDLNIFFRYLHTMKGTARVFNLGHISSVSHQIENKLMVVIEKKDKNQEILWEDINELVQGMYELQGQVNEYLKAARNVFAIEFEEDIKFKEKLHDQIKNLEYWVSQLMLVDCFVDHQDQISRVKSFMGVFKNKSPYQKKVLEELKNLSHSLKGLARGMDERELSEEVHRFEGGILLLEENKDNVEEDFVELFITPLDKIKKLSLNLYLESKKNNIYETLSEQWSFILVEMCEIGLLFKGKNNDNELSQKIYNLHARSISLGLEYLPGVLRILYVVMEEKIVTEKIIRPILKKAWQYLIFFCSLDNNKRYSVYEKSNIKNKIIDKKKLDELSFLEEDSIFINFIKKCDEKEKSYYDILEEISNILNISYVQMISHFVVEEDLSKIVNEMFYEFKKGFNLRVIDSLEGYFKGKENFFKKFKTWFFEEENFSEINYLRSIDLIQILNTFCFRSDDFEEQLKPKTYDVLIENYNQCFDSLFKHIEEDKKIDLDTLNKAFEKLLFLPVKQSFYKFKAIVKDISKTLGKKINFRVVGEQGGLEKERLNLLQEVMVHLVRNSIDHGIEIPSQRLSKGKDEMGTIEIGCSQVSDETFQVKIKDDGGGIDLHRIVQKVIEKDLIGEEELKRMNDKEKLDLIFLPNFSTKENVSEISGRGVGMDVVKKNLENIGAHFEVKTAKDQGTEFIINLDIEKKSLSKNHP